MAGSRWTLAGELLLSLRERRGTGGDGRPCLYVVRVQKFLLGFKSNGSRGSKACHRSASGHRGADSFSLVVMDKGDG